MAIQKGWGPKLTGRLADYANASKGTVLLGDIQAHMMKEYAKPSTRRQDILHPSEMAKEGWCPRSTYYRIKACREASDPFLKPSENIGVQLLNIFDEGHYIHDKWQKRLRDMGDLWGDWQCTYAKCYEIYESTFCPDICEECSGDTFIYREVPLHAEQYLIHGHADGAIPRLKSLIEIKSVGTGTVRIAAPDIYAANTEGSMIDLQGLWKDIKKPFPEHINQGQLYLTLCSLMGLEYDQIVFIYESKYNQGVKEFVVKYDPDYCNEVLKQAELITLALDEENIIPVCPTGTTCKDCEKYSGTEKSDSKRVGESEHNQRTESSRTAVRRRSGSASRLVRPPRP